MPKARRDFKKELEKLMEEQLDAFSRGASEEERIAVFEKIQKRQKDRMKFERKED